MEMTFGSSIAILSLLYLSLVTSPTSAKCRGSFRFDHACHGGNGKRSDPSMELTAPQASTQMLNIRAPGLLHQTLLAGFGSQPVSTSSEKSWPESVENYLSSAYPSGLEDSRRMSGGAGEASLEEREDNSYDTRLGLALAEVLELRKYTNALERLLRSTDSERK